MIDNKRDKKFFKKLASFAIDGIAESDQNDWTQAVVIVEVQPDAVETEGHYFVNDKKKWLELDMNYKFFKKVIAFHESTTSDGSNKWNKLLFSISPNMSFESKYIWDDVMQAEIDKYNDEAEAEDPTYKRPLWPWQK